MNQGFWRRRLFSTGRVVQVVQNLTRSGDVFARGDATSLWVLELRTLMKAKAVFQIVRSRPRIIFYPPSLTLAG